jgi:hypothetical protein
MLGSASQKSHVFSRMWKIDQKDKCSHKYKHDHTPIYVEHVCSSGTVWWEDKREEWGERKTEWLEVNNVETHCIYFGRRHNEVHWQLLKNKGNGEKLTESNRGGSNLVKV